MGGANVELDGADDLRRLAGPNERPFSDRPITVNLELRRRDRPSTSGHFSAAGTHVNPPRDLVLASGAPTSALTTRWTSNTRVGMADPGSLSVVVPVYRSAAILPELVAELEQQLPEVAETFELILVNDGSPDNSWEVIQELESRYEWVRGISLMRNYGQHSALLCGVRAARHEVIVTMDDDLQHPPQEIRTLLEPLADGADVVYGRPEREKHELFRALASQITKLVLQNAMGAETARSISAFRAFRTVTRDAFSHVNSPRPNLDVLLTWGTNRFAAVNVTHAPRREGKSNYTAWMLLIHALNMVTGFSIIPLQVASAVGFLFTAFGGAVLVFVVGRYLLEGAAVPGFAFTASTIAILSGTQLFALGVIGEYLGRMHLRIMARPAYVVRHPRTPHE